MTKMTAEMFGANTPIVPDETLEEWLKDEPVKKMTEKERIQKQIEELQTALKILEIEENRRTPCEKAYRDAYGEFPITDSMSGGDGDYIAWDAFQKGWESSRVYHNKYFVIANSKQEEVKKLQEKDWNIKVETDYLTGKARHKTRIVDKNGKDYKPEPLTTEELLRPQPEKRKIDDLSERLLPDDHPYKIADEHGETNRYKQYLNSVKTFRQMISEYGFTDSAIEDIIIVLNRWLDDNSITIDEDYYTVTLKLNKGRIGND